MEKNHFEAMEVLNVAEMELTNLTEILEEMRIIIHLEWELTEPLEMVYWLVVHRLLKTRAEFEERKFFFRLCSILRNYYRLNEVKNIYLDLIDDGSEEKD